MHRQQFSRRKDVNQLAMPLPNDDLRLRAFQNDVCAVQYGIIAIIEAKSHRNGDEWTQAMETPRQV